MTKKLVATLMAVILAVGCLAGCGNKGTESKSSETTKATESQQASTQESTETPEVEEIPNFNPEGYPIVNEPITLKVLWCINDSVDLAPFEEIPAIQKMEEETGIHLEAEIVKKADFDTKINLLFTTGEYPDFIICSQGTLNYEEYGVAQQIVIPLDELIEKYLPTYNTIAADQLVEPGAMLRASDGQLYTIPFGKSNSGQLSGNVFWINSEWLEALGLETPKTIDDLTDVLRAFKTQDPNGNGEADEIPMSVWDTVLTDVLHLFGLPGLGSNNMWINDDKKVEFIPTADAYRECLEWLHQLYEEELLDVEMFSQDQNTFNAKLESLKVGAFPAYRLNSTAFESTIGKYEVWYTEDTRYGWSLGISSNDSAYITCTNEYPEATMRIFEYMLDLENVEDFYSGPKDDPDKGWRYNDEGLVELYSNISGAEASVDVKCFSNSGMCFVPSSVYNARYHKGASNLERISLGELLSSEGNIIEYSWHFLNMVKFDSEVSEKIGLIRTDMKNALAEYRTNFIRDGITDESWAAYCKVIEDMGNDYIIEKYQEKVDEMDIIVPNGF